MKVRMERLSSILVSFLLVSTMVIGCSDSNDDPSDFLLDNSVDDAVTNVDDSPEQSSDDTTDETTDDASEDTSVINEEDKSALLFMLEEEKLARDTYKFLNAYWGMVQFENIMQSEQSHMNAVEALLKAYHIEYEILDEGQFGNEALQAWYDKFVTDGIVDEVAALTVGATIEDLDIVDLEDHILAATKADIAEVFSSLQCGSRNHLRSFTQSLENLGANYSPQFLTQEAYETILDGSREQCN